MAHLVAAGLLGTGVSGHVLQTVWKQNEAQSMEAAGDVNTYTSGEVSDAITTREANSKIFIHTISFGSHCQNGTRGEVWLQRAISGGATSQLEQSKLIDNYYNRASGDVSQYEPLILDYMDSPGVAAGTTITYAARYARATGSNSFYWVHTGHGVLVVLQEISA
jgi:hypothetical protein